MKDKILLALSIIFLVVGVALVIGAYKAWEHKKDTNAQQASENASNLNLPIVGKWGCLETNPNGTTSNATVTFDRRTGFEWRDDGNHYIYGTYSEVAFLPNKPHGKVLFADFDRGDFGNGFNKIKGSMKINVTYLSNNNLKYESTTGDTKVNRTHECSRVKSVGQDSVQNHTAVKTLSDCPECPDMVEIPAGSFDMGSNNDNYVSMPVHRVTIGKAFALGKTEVTQGQWKLIMGNNPSGFANCGENCPVETVTWYEVHAFIQKLNAKTGKQYRLPSEAEWEYACRAGAQQQYCGSDNIDSVAWYVNNSGDTTHPVASKQPNAFGLYDMTGNVDEWVEDGAHSNYRGSPTDGSAWNADANANEGVFRGGSQPQSAWYMYATSRGGSNLSSSGTMLGFRLARELSTTIPAPLAGSGKAQR